MLKAVLLNDTAILDGAIQHLGCWATCDGLARLLSSRGITIADRISSPAVGRLCGVTGAADFDAVAARASAQPILVINGEGTMHHDTARARMILQIARRALIADCRVWLVNSEWFEMSDDSARLAGEFEHVAIRSHLNYQRALGQGIRSAVLSADCSWLLPPAIPPTARAWTDDGRAGEPIESGQPETLLVASGLREPSPVAVRGITDRLRLTAERTSSFYPQTGGVRTDTWSAEFARFGSAAAVLTSSFHAANFAAIHRTPFFWLPSCTPKIADFAAEVFGPDLYRGVSVDPAWLAAAQRALAGVADALRARALLNCPEDPHV